MTKNVTAQMDAENAKAGRYSFEDIHRVLFPQKPAPRKLAELKRGIADHMRKKYARD